MWDMNYPQIMSPVPFASKSGGHVPPAPMGAPPMNTARTTLASDKNIH